MSKMTAVPCNFSGLEIGERERETAREKAARLEKRGGWGVGGPTNQTIQMAIGQVEPMKKDDGGKL